MADEQKKTENPFEKCCAGVPFREMITKMMEKRMGGAPCDCAEMMSRMAGVCCGPPEKKMGAEVPKEKEQV